MKVSVVLPTYNEAENIVLIVQAVIEHMPPDWDYEVLVVDDNSPDGTYEAARTVFAGNPRVVPVLRTEDRGLAKSIRAGLERATGDYVVVMDTDFNHDPAELPRMLHLALASDIVVGSRFCAGGNMQDLRHYTHSLVYNWFIRLMLRTQIQDNLSGFFAADRSLLMGLPFDPIFFGYGDYFFRLLHFAQWSDMRVLEMPVQYQTRIHGRSKSNFLRLLFSYTWALLKLRWSVGLRVLKEKPRKSTKA